MSELEFFNQKPETDVFSKINQQYLPFWPLFIVFTSISLIISIIYLRSQVPTYVASTKVLLKDPNRSSDTKVLDALNIFGERKIVDNEIVVLRSTTLMTDVVKALNIYGLVYNQGRVKIEDLYGYNSPLWIEAIDKQNIHSSDKYYFSIDWLNKVILIDGKKVRFDSTVSLNFDTFRLRINPYYHKNIKGKNFFLQITQPEALANNIVGNLHVSPTSNTSTVLNVSLETSEPEKGKAILNKLIFLYNQNAIEDKNQISFQTLAFIDDRLRLVSGQLDSVEKRIVTFKASEQIFDLSKQSESYMNSVKDLDKKNSDLDLQLDILNEINNYVRNKGGRQGTVPSIALVSDPILSSLLSKLYESETELARIKSIVGEQNTASIQKEEEITKVKRDILENISNIRRTLTAAKIFNTGLINKNDNMLTAVPQKERQLLEISRNQVVKNALYTYLLQKREETAISSASTVSDLRMVERPSAYGPVKPVATTYYLSGFVIGMLLSIFIILVKERLNNKILFRSELEEKTKVPVVGELMQVNTNEPVVVAEGKRSIIAEQFRSIRTNLGFTGINQTGNKTILITSSISGEGKSFVAINLAISFSLMNKKVGLLEMDLRKPRLSKLMKIKRDPGISNFLVGNATIEEIIKPTDIKNLFIISSGPIPPNPAELLLGPTFSVMMEELKKQFDYLIIDTAPIGPVSDAQLITEFAHTTIFVVRHDFTPKVFYRMIKTMYELKRYKNMTILFNGLKRRGIPIYNSDYGGYDYGYGYGYGYGGGYSYGNSYYIHDKKEKTWLRKLFERKTT